MGKGVVKNSQNAKNAEEISHENETKYEIQNKNATNLQLISTHFSAHDIRRWLIKRSSRGFF